MGNRTSQNKQSANSDLDAVMAMLHQIAKILDTAIEIGADNDKISDVVELMRGISEDNYMFIRN